MKPFAIIIPLLLFALSCDTSEPPSGGEPSVQFSAVDASCTEVWLQVKMLAGVPQRTIRIQRDSTTILSTTITASETLIVDEGLLPNRQYNYILSWSNGLFMERASTAVTTLDTTSHNFTFQIDTLGVTSSVLYDVAIISDTNIWAVGELFLNDSSGNLDPILYNAAHWDGTQWNIIRIPYIYQGSQSFSSIKALFAFSENDIWFSNSVHWNGQQFHNVDLAISIFYGIGINKIWGNTANEELYVVGNSGTIAYSPDHGGAWQRVDSGTNINLVDVCGVPSGAALWVCGYANDFSHSVVLQRVGQQWRMVIDIPITAPPSADTISGSIASVWAVTPSYAQIASSGGIYRTDVRSSGEARRTWYPSPNSTGFFHRVRGPAKNNAFVVGAFGTVAHFNGSSWFQFEQLFDFSTGPRMLSVTMRGNRMIAVGTQEGKAIVLGGTAQ